MELQHPFSGITPSAQGRALAVLAVLTVAIFIVFLMIGAPLYTEAAPLGILSYEFAGSQDQAAKMLDSWSSSAREQAMFFQGLDYLYLFIYPVFISLGCVRVALRLSRSAPRRAYLGIGLSWLVLAAGLFDAVENYALIRQLLTVPSDLWAQIAWWCALFKFGLVIVGLGYMLAGYGISRFQSEG